MSRHDATMLKYLIGLLVAGCFEVFLVSSLFDCCWSSEIFVYICGRGYRGYHLLWPTRALEPMEVNCTVLFFRNLVKKDVLCPILIVDLPQVPSNTKIDYIIIIFVS